MFVIAGVTGNTGSVVANTLLARGQKVRVLVRDAAKAEPFRQKGAEVAIGSIDDAASLKSALRGAKGAYLLLPPDLTHPDPLARAQKFIDAWTTALPGSGVEHVALLSSIGAQHADGNGPIKMLHRAEQALSKLSIPATFVRAGYFVENWASVLGAAAKDGVLPTFERPEVAFPMIATRDIGETAAHALLEPSKELRVINLAGPKDLSPNDVASIVGTLLGREVKALHVAGDAIVGTLQGFGFSLATAQSFREMAEGIDRGHVAWEPGRGTLVRGKTSVESVLGPLLPR